MARPRPRRSHRHGKGRYHNINDIYYEPDGLAAAIEAIALRAQLCDEIFDVAKENLIDGDYTRYPDRGSQRLRRSLEFSGEVAR
jgi:hypothetical protein